MPFYLPTFNLFCNIWNVQHDFFLGPPIGLPTQALVPCSLQFGRKNEGGASTPMHLLLPALTNINGQGAYPFTVNGILVGDSVEVPAGSGRFYCTFWVDDVAKGYPTEYRVADIERGGELSQQLSGAYFDPIPWP